uniref:Galectin domain-containing protein n=1 Tax=Globodera rostochiensis TaxID=31243 RepID=A0A914HQZ3_GLORO
MRHFDEEETPIKICNKSNAIEFRFIVEQKYYEIKVNGENLFGNYTNSISVCEIKHVMLDGNVNLLEQDKFVPSAVAATKSKFVYVTRTKNAQKFEEAAGINTKKFESRNNELNIKPEKPTTLEILMGKDGFYGKKNNGDYWYKLCLYYNPYNKSISTLPIPPWTIDHISVNASTFDTQNIRVVKASSREDELDLEDINTCNDPGRKRILVPWKRINFTQVIKQEGVDRANYSVFVNITLEENLTPMPRVAIRFFNEALEFHDLFGSTVMWMELSTDILFFNSFVNLNKTWSEPNYGFKYMVNLKVLEDNDVTPTTDLIEQFSTDTLNPLMAPQTSSYTLNSTIDQMPNSSTFMTTTDQKKSFPLKLFFKIDVHETDGEAEFYVTLNGHDKDVNNQKVLKYQCPTNVRVPAIQYITVSHGENTLAADSAELKVSCSSAVICVNKG